VSQIQNGLVSKFKASPVKLAAVVAFLFTGLLAFINLLINIASLPDLFKWATPGYGNPFPQAAAHDLFVILSLPFVCLCLAITGLLMKNQRIWAALVALYFLATVPVALIVNALFYQNFSSRFEIVRWQMVWTNNEMFDTALTVIFIVSTVIGVGSIFIPTPAVDNSSMPAVPAESIRSSANSGNPSAPLSNLPIFALVGAFVIPIAGIILGHLSISQMNKGIISNQNRGMAMAGLILGYVFIALSILLGVLIAVALIASRSSYYY